MEDFEEFLFKDISENLHMKSLFYNGKFYTKEDINKIKSEMINKSFK